MAFLKPLNRRHLRLPGKKKKKVSGVQLYLLFSLENQKQTNNYISGAGSVENSGPDTQVLLLLSPVLPFLLPSHFHPQDRRHWLGTVLDNKFTGMFRKSDFGILCLSSLVACLSFLTAESYSWLIRPKKRSIWSVLQSDILPGLPIFCSFTHKVVSKVRVSLALATIAYR